MAGIIIEARVQQKTDTEAAWMANELPLLPGECAFVAPEGSAITNFKVNTFKTPRLFSELPYIFTAALQVPFFGTATPASTPSPSTGSGFWIALTAGTYTNYGGVVLPATTLGVITRVGTTYSITTVSLDITVVNKPIKYTGGGNLDFWRGPYPDKAAACLAIPNVMVEGKNLREGKFVDIGTPEKNTTYKWVNGFVDSDLVEIFVDLATKTSLEIYAKRSVLLNPSINLYNKKANLPGYYINDATGGLSTNVLYEATDFISIEPNTQYVTKALHRSAWYDANKVFVSGSAVNTGIEGVITSPINAVYYRQSVLAAKKDTFVFAKGTVLPVYSDYLETLKKELITELPSKKIVDSYQVFNKAITPEKTSFVAEVSGKNLFNIAASDVSLGRYINDVNGNLSTNAAYNVTGFIPVKTETDYALSYKHAIAWYDANKVFISSSPSSDLSKHQTSPAGAAYIRCTVLLDKWDKFQVEEGNDVTDWEEYYLLLELSDIKVPKESLPRGIRTADTKITPLDLSFATFKLGKNLFNIAASDVAFGRYINTVNGNLSTNEAYNVTGFIPVKTETDYALSYKHAIAWYDANKVFISSSPSSDLSKHQTSPAGAAYIRCTVLLDKWDKFQVEEGNDVTAWEKYEEYYKLEGVKTDSGDTQPVNPATDVIELFLPPEICVAVGRTIELYNDQVASCGNINNFHFNWSCNVGQSKKRKFTITGTAGTVGQRTLTLNVYNNNSEVVASATTLLKIVNVAADITTPRRIVCIGDSLTNEKPWLAEVKSLATAAFGKNVLDFVGTLGTTNKHEGRSGFTAKNYVIDSSYAFQGNVQLAVTGVSIPPALKKKYTLPGATGQFEVEKYTLDGSGNGTIDFNRINGSGNVTTNGQAIAVESGTVGLSPINYTTVLVTSGNPFWNPVTSKVDFAYYSSQHGIAKPDFVQIFLGTNGLSTDPSETVSSIKILVDAIKRDWEGTKIFIVFTLYGGNQDGIAKTSGTGVIKILQYRKIFNLAKSLHAALKDYTNLFFVPIAQAHDSEYNFGAAEVDVNPRNNSYLLKEPTEATHPQTPGYLQMADIIYSTWLAHY